MKTSVILLAFVLSLGVTFSVALDYFTIEYVSDCEPHPSIYGYENIVLDNCFSHSYDDSSSSSSEEDDDDSSSSSEAGFSIMYVQVGEHNVERREFDEPNCDGEYESERIPLGACFEGTRFRSGAPQQVESGILVAVTDDAGNACSPSDTISANVGECVELANDPDDLYYAIFQCTMAGMQVTRYTDEGCHGSSSANTISYGSCSYGLALLRDDPCRTESESSSGDFYGSYSSEAESYEFFFSSEGGFESSGEESFEFSSSEFDFSFSEESFDLSSESFDFSFSEESFEYSSEESFESSSSSLEIDSLDLDASSEEARLVDIVPFVVTLRPNVTTDALPIFGTYKGKEYLVGRIQFYGDVESAVNVTVRGIDFSNYHDALDEARLTSDDFDVLSALEILCSVEFSFEWRFHAPGATNNHQVLGLSHRYSDVQFNSGYSVLGDVEVDGEDFITVYLEDVESADFIIARVIIDSSESEIDFSESFSVESFSVSEEPSSEESSSSQEVSTTTSSASTISSITAMIIGTILFIAY